MVLTRLVDGKKVAVIGPNGCGKSTLLLLDEPTNQLDIAGRQWLEEWLSSSPAATIIVSHDRAFLDATVESVAELERGVLTVWPGNYSAAMAAKAAEAAAQQRRHDAQRRAKRQLELAAGRLGSQARSAGKFSHRRAGNQAPILTKAKTENVSRTLARRQRALKKRLERLEVTPEPPDAYVTPELPLPEVATGPGEVLRFEGVTLARGGRTLVEEL